LFLFVDVMLCLLMLPPSWVRVGQKTRLKKILKSPKIHVSN
jgi:hypothetical protein